MANISSAFGTLDFKGTWNKSLFEKFISIFNKHLNDKVGDYYLIIDNENFEKGEANIRGIGRWTFENNLSLMNNWALNSFNYSTQTKEECESEWENLLKEVHEKELIIEIDYVDEESGLEYLVSNAGIIDVQETDEGLKLVYELMDSDEYEYNRSNLIALDIYDEEDFEVQLKDIKETLLEDYKLIYRNDKEHECKKLTQAQEDEIEKVLDDNPWAGDVEDILVEIDWL
ncbi:hypothetical protein [Lactococcus fujiensis]|uniref:Uncharacterized protein n=1 Tax=Lactococcus fujiensis JCM 16395 TaxID=1291764 RepID=A0A2A5RI56_9LACT|nr:hypothetical protein [Lactococcus fujiensis]PCR98798.1 hypothetical protein RT41_GL000906 [Lactococcus fujiensis JCM 16395]